MKNFFEKLHLRPQFVAIFLLIAASATTAWYLHGRVGPVVSDASICDLYTAPNGTISGNGTIGNPWDLVTAVKQPASITSGKTICMRGGTYSGKYISSLVGATLRSAPGEWAKVDGYYTTTTTSALDASQNTIDIGGTFQFSPAQVVIIDSEHVQINQVVSPGRYLIVRGWNGTSAVPHSVGAPVRLTGNTFELYGNNSIYRDFEVMNSNPKRVYPNTTGYGGSLRGEGEGFMVFGDDLKIINTVVHDNGDGIFVTEIADNLEVYGAIVYNNGHVASDRPHGHGLYVQNDSADDFYKEIISFNNFALGMKAYGANQGHSNNVHIEGFIAFNNGTPGYFPGNPTQYPNSTRGYGNLEIGSDVYPSTNISVTDSYLYHKASTTVEIAGLWLGRAPTGGNSGATVQNNFIVDPISGITLNQWSNVNISGNTIVNLSSPDPNVKETLLFSSGARTGHNINNNSYYDLSPLAECFGFDRYTFVAAGLTSGCGSVYLKFNEWKNGTGLDVNSTYSNSRPTGKNIFVRPNAYEAGRANIAVYNWDLSPTVTVSLNNAGLTPGQQFEIRTAENYMGAPVLSNQTYSAGMSVTLPMTNLTVATPIGHTFTPASTCPEFCAFVVVPISSGGSTPTVPTISSFSANPTSISSGQSSTLSWSVNGATSLSINQGVGTVTGSSKSVSPTVTTTYTLTATNSAGTNTATTTITVTPAGDTTPPTVSLTAPANGATVSGAATTVSATASDNVGVAGVQFKLDGVNLGNEDTSSPYTISWDTTQAVNGSHSITAVARDAAGNITTSAARAVTVSNVTPPTVVATPVISPNGGTFSSSQKVSLSTTTTNATIRYTTDGSNPSSTIGTVYSGDFSVSSNTTIKAIAYKAGSTDSSIASATFTITPVTNGPAPVITSISITSKTQSSATIQWKTDISSTGSIAYGTSRNNLNLTAQETNPATCSNNSCTHILTITGLNRNTNYRYQITATNNNASTTSVISSFKTAR